MPTLKEQYGSFLAGSLKEKYGQFLDVPEPQQFGQSFAGALPQPDIMPQVGGAGMPPATGPSLGGRVVAGIVEPAARFLSDQAQELQTDISEMPHYAGPDWSLGGRDMTPAEQTYAEAPPYKQLGYSAAHTGASLVGGPMGFMASLPQMGLDVVNPPEGQTGLGRLAEEGRGFGQMLANFPEQVRYAGTLGMDRGVSPEAVQSFHQTGGAEPLFTAGILSGVSGLGKAMRPVIPEVRGRYAESGMLPRTRVAELGRMAPEYPRMAPEGLGRKAQPRAEWPEKLRQPVRVEPGVGLRAKVGDARGARSGTKEGLALVEKAKDQLRDVISNPDIVGKQRADAIANGRELVQFLEANMDTRKPLEVELFRGNKVAFTGIVDKGGFREFITLEGADAGKTVLRPTREMVTEGVVRKKAEFVQQQKEFAQLHKPKLKEAPDAVQKREAAQISKGEQAGRGKEVRQAQPKKGQEKEVAKQPKVITFDEFSARRGVSNFAPDHPEMYKVPGGVSKPTARAADKRLLRESAEWQDKRNALRAEYDDLVTEGKVRPPGRKETLEATAKGEGVAAAAAKRLLKKHYPDLAKKPVTAAKNLGERWDSAKLGVRVEWAIRSGYVTKAGKLTRTGERLAESKWSNISESGQNVLGRRIAKDYPNLTMGVVAGAAIAALSDEESRDIALAGMGLAFGATRKGRKAAVEKAVKRPFATMVEFQKAISTDPKGIIGKKGKQLPGMATRTTKGGNVVPSIRRSGVFVPEEVTKYKNYEDIPSTLENSMDPTRAIQRMDGSLSLTEKAKTEGQAGPIERNVSWRTRDMMKLRGAFISEFEGLGKKLLKDVDKNERIAITRGLENKKSTNPKIREVRAFLDELIENQNEIRKLRNQKEIPYRHRYAPHILRRSTIWSQAYGLLSSVDKIMKRGPKDKPSMPDFILPNKPFNPRELARQAGLKGFEREMDIGKLLSQYINTAARDIFNTSIIENNKAFATQLESMGHTKSASFIQRWTAEAFAGVGGKVDRAIGLTAGTWPVPQLKKAAHKFRRALVLSAFPLNVGWNTAVQTSSFNFTLTKYGPINSARGAFDWFTSKDKRQGVRENAYSYIIKRGGSGRMATQDISRGMASQARIAKSKMETTRDAMNFFTDLVENNLTGASVLAAKRHGENAGLKGKALWEYASDGGAKTQSMYNLEDLPGALRNEIVKTGAPFQTFKFEAYNNLKEWSGKAGVKPESHKIRAKQAITFLAGAYAFNQIGKEITGREPWGHDSFIPFYDVIVGPAVAAIKGERTEYKTKRGLPAPTGVTLELGKAVHDIMVKDDWAKARKWGLRYLPGSVGIGGGTQINRVVDGLIANSRGGVYTSTGWEMGRDPVFPISGAKEKFRSIMFGPYGTTAGKEYLGKRKKSWLDLYRSMRADQNLKGPPERTGRTGRTGRGGR